MKPKYKIGDKVESSGGIGIVAKILLEKGRRPKYILKGENGKFLLVIEFYNEMPYYE